MSVSDPPAGTPEVAGGDDDRLRVSGERSEAICAAGTAGTGSSEAIALTAGCDTALVFAGEV
jgi:hypothetical protein